MHPIEIQRQIDEQRKNMPFDDDDLDEVPERPIEKVIKEVVETINNQP